MNTNEGQIRQKVQFDLNSTKKFHYSDHFSSNLMKSHSIQQNYKFEKYDAQGNASLVGQNFQIQKGFSYRKVNTQQESQQIFGVQINWKQDISQIQSLRQHKIVMKPLRKLYQKDFRPQFFSQIEQTKGLSFKYYNQQIPQCLYQMHHLSRSHVKSHFITQNYAQNGFYQIVINQDGRFRLMKINDLVPVYQQTNQHIWDIEQPWKMILLKAWACLNNGYTNILTQNSPFEFLEHFTSHNWKYYNLQRQKDTFIKYFKNKKDISYIVLQTRNSNQVQKMGLVPNSIAYELIGINNVKSKDGLGFTSLQVKSKFKHKWKGQLNFIKHLQSISQKQDRTFKLEKNFVLTKDQFSDVFGCAYITSLTKSNTHVTDCYKLLIPKMSKKAIYLKFTIKQETFLDFSFIQSHTNKKMMQNNKSLIDHSNYHKETGMVSTFPKNRYLKCKYMLIKSLKGNKNSFKSKLAKQIQKKQPQLTYLAKYQAYQVEYLRGYNKGQAHFMTMEPGQYYLRLKSQMSDKDAIYYLNYCSTQMLQLTEQIMSEQERQDIMDNCILSLLPAAKIYKTKTSRIYSGKMFETMGYGFIVLQNLTSKQNNPTQILLQINLNEIEAGGYELKGKKYKNQSNSYVFKVVLSKYLILTFKKPDSQDGINYLWPPNGINIFRSSDLKDQI